MSETDTTGQDESRSENIGSEDIESVFEDFDSKRVKFHLEATSNPGDGRPNRSGLYSGSDQKKE